MFVGGGLFVNVGGGGGLFGLRVAVGGITCVLIITGDGEGEAVGVAVGMADAVRVTVGVGINSENASNVRTEFGLENAKFTTSPASMAIGSSRDGSDNATADAPQNKPKPRVLAANIQRRPA